MGPTIEIGTTYRSPLHGRDIMVIGIDRSTSDHTVLAVLWVERDTQQTTPGELTVYHTDFRNWKKVEY